MSKRDKSNKGLTRRDLLQHMGTGALGFGQMGFLAQTVIDGIFNNAYAQATGTTNKKYVFLQEYAAPPRWMFDLPLAPDGDMSKFVRGSHFGNRYKSASRYTEVEYATSLQNGIHMPWMWSFDIPTSDGNFTPLSNLMDGMLVLRGINTHNPAHEAAAKLHYRPQGIPMSLGAMTADASNNPLAAVNLGSSYFNFKSLTGASASSIDIAERSGNAIQSLIGAFRENSLPAYESNQNKIASSLEKGISSLNKFSKDQYPETELLKNNMENSLELFSTDFGDVNSTYSNLVAKYTLLIKRALDMSRPLPGISDKPVGTTGTRDKKYNWRDGDSNLVTRTDVRGMFYGSTYLGTMPHKFATAEFALTNGLTSSISFGLRALLNMYSNDGNTRFHQRQDEHGCGVMISTIMNTYRYMAISSCLFEFITVLKSKSLYKDTVIDLCGEFGRNPLTNGFGSDHSPEGNSNTLFSGAVKGTQVIGNILGNPTDQKYAGTWGYQGNNPGYGLLNLGHFVSTLSHLLELPSPVTAVPSLLKEENGGLVSKTGLGKIV